jgi:hypothetical protein
MTRFLTAVRMHVSSSSYDVHVSSSSLLAHDTFPHSSIGVLGLSFALSSLCTKLFLPLLLGHKLLRARSHTLAHVAAALFVDFAVRGLFACQI